MFDEEDLVMKIVVIGDGLVGKTSFLCTFMYPRVDVSQCLPTYCDVYL